MEYCIIKSGFSVFLKNGCQEKHRHMAWAGPGLPKVSSGPAMPYPSSPYGRATLETAHGRFKGGLPIRLAARDHLLPLWTPHAARLCQEKQNGKYLVW
jgi:hypothetical protein